MTPHKNQASLEKAVAAPFGIKFYADGAGLEDFARQYNEGLVSGFTTNPTLMHKAGVKDYEKFARELLALIPDMPISLEVFSDEFDDMRRQARLINSWGPNVYVKIPVTNTRRESSLDLVAGLADEGIKVNVTAILTLEKVAQTIDALNDEVPAVISIFAGRIADTGIDPCPIMRAAVAMVYQANDCGCHIITAPGDILKKLKMIDMNLDDLSQDTVQMFYKDAISAGFTL
jgi:transaldolase